jgi:hypothetical protein
MLLSTAICVVKITPKIELTWQPTHPSTGSESLSAKAIQRQLCHDNIDRSNCVKEDEKNSKHYQLTENRAEGEDDEKRTNEDATTNYKKVRTQRQRKNYGE